jgi:hypothetical protein
MEAVSLGTSIVSSSVSDGNACVGDQLLESASLVHEEKTTRQEAKANNTVNRVNFFIDVS